MDSYTSRYFTNVDGTSYLGYPSRSYGSSYELWKL